MAQPMGWQEWGGVLPLYDSPVYSQGESLPYDGPAYSQGVSHAVKAQLTEGDESPILWWPSLQPGSLLRYEGPAYRSGKSPIL
jgi:hypothetical protein